MDEGINSFTEYEMMDRRWGGPATLPFGADLSSFDLGRLQTISAREVDRLVTPSWGFADDAAYGRNSYARGATAVDQLRRVLGEETFWRAFKAWAERWRFDHPTTEDFLDAFRPHAGGALEPLIRETWYGNGKVDYAVSRASSREARPFEGYDDRGKKVAAPKAAGTKGGKRWESTVLVTRTGTIPLPVEVVLTFEDGATWRKTWDGRAPWLRLRATSAARLATAEVDPGRRVVLDADPWNNARRLGGRREASAAAKVRAYAVHGVQILLSSLWPLL